MAFGSAVVAFWWHIAWSIRGPPEHVLAGISNGRLEGEGRCIVFLLPWMWFSKNTPRDIEIVLSFLACEFHCVV